MKVISKVCTKCERMLPVEGNFHRDRTHHDGYRSQCRDCKRLGDIAYKEKKNSAKRAKTEAELVEQAMLDKKAKAHRNAILRLISNHRAEFDSIVQGELTLIIVNEEREENAKAKGYWMNAG